MKPKYHHISEYFVAIDFFEQMSKQVDIVLEKGKRREEISWQNYRHLPSLQDTLGNAAWFIPDPLAFYNPGKLDEVLHRATFNFQTKTLHIDLCGGTIILQDTPLDLTTPEAQNKRGMDYLRQEDYDQAMTHLQKAVELNPQYPQAWNSLGLAYYYQQNAKQAEMCYRKAVECHPSYSGAWTNLGRSLEAQERLEEAEQAHLTALRHDPMYGGAWQNLGNVYLLQGEWAKALGAFHESLRVEPDNYEVLTNLGSTYLFQRKYEEALECFQSALLLAPPGFVPFLDDLITKARQRISVDNLSIQAV